MARRVKVKMLGDNQTIDGRTYAEGDTVEVSPDRAKALTGRGVAELVGDEDATADKPTKSGEAVHPEPASQPAARPRGDAKADPKADAGKATPPAGKADHPEKKG